MCQIIYGNKLYHNLHYFYTLLFFPPTFPKKKKVFIYPDIYLFLCKQTCSCLHANVKKKYIGSAAIYDVCLKLKHFLYF